MLCYGLYLLLYDQQWPALGVSLMAMGPLSFIGSLYTRNKGRASRFPALPTILLSTGVIFALQNPIPPQNLLMALMAAGGWMAYLGWYAKLDRPDSELKMGEPLPLFSLPSAQGPVYKSTDFVGHPTLWLFFRGNWCPLCMAQIKEIAKQYKDIAAQGAKVVLISPQPESQSLKLAQKYKVPFVFLVDQGLKVARQLGLFHEQGLPAGMQALGYQSDTVFPTLILTDTQGKIQFMDQTDDYRLRPEPGVFLRLLQQKGVSL